MGKTTRIHPVALPILRESARQGGIRLGRIHQDKISDDQLSALYTAEVFNVPIEFGGALPTQIQSLINGLFSSDVWVLRCWFTKSHKIMIELATTIDPLNASRAATHWLLPRSQDGVEEAQSAELEALEPLERDWLDDSTGPIGEEI